MKITVYRLNGFFENSKGRSYITEEIIDKMLEVFHKRNNVGNFSDFASLSEIEKMTITLILQGTLSV